MAPTPTTDWVRSAAARTPSAAAVITADETVAYADLDALIDGAASTLRNGIGVRAGTRVGVVAVAQRRIDTLVLLWAVRRIGAVAVLVDPADPALDDRAALQQRWGLTAVVERVARSYERVSIDSVLLEPGAHHSWIPTSGSSGTPRPVVLTERNIAAAITASQSRLGNGRDDRWLAVLPLFHVGGLSILWRSAAAGSAVVLHDRFDAAAVAEAMLSGAVTLASLVPTMLHRVLAADRGPYEGVHAVLLGGAPAPASLVAEALDAGLPVLATYGMTEACSQVATVAPTAPDDSLTTVGRPLDGFDVSVEAPDANGAGELLVDGPAVSPGYAGEPPRIGPHRTGDMGRFDENGRLIVIGRRDHVIVTGGENVQPGAVEATLRSHPEVAEVAVYGLPDAEWGQVVAASVVARHEGLDVAALDAFARACLAPQQRPKRWSIVGELPHLPNGKLDRTRLAAAGELPE